ncbi:2,3-diaminopropionate biosynthesis protein SbnB [Staphylococcus arlettae]|jgi:N-[(2S)-2-amino-2-carboxyethyl]-L-glutamate dehydrogenase|uniref:2,3-diaminopropionate biosynthesis protein SbnB n=1 Tax=Staphylococcus TaxID=1279 RepID=UPI000D1A3771|nr:MULTISPECIES: 2,3-diaminopropionate biosynthesis protein SbnB [Staphylococcus]MBF0737150.1 2,3-diaminopropionate biosynthesis protein SbnB [Staphylococcus arlettae]MCD8816202.1 2,3-diaminopropionate biosynthesis protein SbnB [Staphylococcus arlettae]MCD8833841.1 2,3-diaminopropionate biosynthesis protein SbnB [Staphylococcus arlettae]MCD8838679.1 2,3-diaminopropionate biosynthesis protein SbnB [Staphylococcus arlettae]MCD8841266.1 2,3-diaminopropionate biosynthesis protein SbnB [Staphylococ
MNKALLYLNRTDVAQAGGDHSDVYVAALSEALTAHAKQDFVQPLKPYLRAQGKEGHIADRIIAMPSHIGGQDPVSGIKWIGSKHDNPTKRQLERASGVIILNDPETNYPIAVMEASLISSMRTAAVSVIAAQHLAKEGFTDLTIIGCGLIGDRQLQSMLEQFDHIQQVYVYDQFPEASDKFVSKWAAAYPDVNFVQASTAREAVEHAEVLITCTVTDQPYIEYEWLQKGVFISNISIMDIQKEVFVQADKVIVDDWSQANREKKTLNQLVLEGRFSEDALHAELGQLLTGDKPGREHDDEIILLNPMGMAIEDISSAYHIYKRAQQQQIGTTLNLY